MLEEGMDYSKIGKEKITEKTVNFQEFVLQIYSCM